MLSKMIYESGRRYCVGELLEFLGSIINGFALPLKEEPGTSLPRLCSLCTKRKSLAFHQRLSACMAQSVEKDSRPAYNIISSMLRYWPASITIHKHAGALPQRPRDAGILFPIFFTHGRGLSSPALCVARPCVSLSFCIGRRVVVLGIRAVFFCVPSL